MKREHHSFEAVVSIKWHIITLISSLLLVSCVSQPSQSQKKISADSKPLQWRFGTSHEIRAYATNTKRRPHSDLLVQPDNTLTRNRRPKHGVKLTDEQAARVHTILHTAGNRAGDSKCVFQPHHAVVFYAGDGSLLASIDICFTCTGYVSRSDHKAFPKHLNYPLLEAFFQELGLLKRVSAQ